VVKNNSIKLLALLLALSTLPVQAQDLWQPIAAKGTDSSGQHYRLQQTDLWQLLTLAPLETDGADSIEVTLPSIGGAIERFSLQESPIMQSGLAARYPDIKTYKIYGIDNPSASGRLSISPAGFHGMITSPQGTFFIDPEGGNSYRAYRKSKNHGDHGFNCGVEGHNHDTPVGTTLNRVLSRAPGNLRVYRTAISATEEFVDAPEIGGSKASTITAVSNIINRVNQIYERDLAIRLELVNNTDDLFFESGDPFTNGNTGAMLDENQIETDNAIGSANYDVGHVMGTGGGGVAGIGVVCDSRRKAKGATTGNIGSLLNDSFIIDFVAHEIGHQFNADHTFNGTTNACSGTNRAPGEAFEPGSGSTIMAYAGICGGENIQGNSDILFHTKSIEDIDHFTTTGNGSNCGSLLAISNPNEPVVDAGNNFTIPVSTPFVLTADGSDADGDTLSYTWDQIDIGTATNSGTYGTDLGNNPLMRSLPPRSAKSRFFPQFETVLDGSTDKTETLPTTNRDLNFRVSVRDDKSGFGTDDMVITARNNAGPFTVTSHGNTATLGGGDSQNITWNVANTDQAPVNCANVDIDLLMFDNAGDNYCTESLKSSTTNDGSETITLPDMSVDKARVRVSCSDNIFYALSTADLELVGASAANTSCNSVATESEEHETSGGSGSSGSGGSGSGGTSSVLPIPGGSSSSGGGGGSMPAICLFILLAVRFSRLGTRL